MHGNLNKGFTLVELISVIVLVGVLSVTVFYRLASVNSVSVQSGRDDVIAALFFAQQQAMMRSNITLVIAANSVSVNESGTPILVSNNYYPLTMPAGVSLSATTTTLIYDKLGRTTAGTITLTGTGNSSGASASIRVEASGYAYY